MFDPKDYEQQDREIRFERRRGYQPLDGNTRLIVFATVGLWSAICFFIGYLVGSVYG